MRSRIVLGLCLCACAPTDAPQPLLLPEPVSNNAAAYHPGTNTAYSFAGLLSGKTWLDVTARAFACDLDAKVCSEILALPDGVGRLASTAQTIGDDIYIFGGYTVAEDGHEVSTPDVFAYNVISQSYSRKASIPVPTDDAVSGVHNERYIYLISGWSMDDNIDDVQVYDTVSDSWAAATPFPGNPVFGHAGAILNGAIVVCDGVIVVPPKAEGKRRTFEGINACYRGDISADDVTNITWRKLAQLPGKGHYRMAAGAWPEMDMIVLAGGTDNPYNYNGIGYDKNPSAPSKHVWAYNLKTDDYEVLNDLQIASMDHRGLLHLGDYRFLILGGMHSDQTVTDQVQVVTVHND